MTRREFLAGIAAGAAAVGSGASIASESDVRVPRGTVSIGFCNRYEYRGVRSVLARMFSELGDVGGLVRGKHVTVKVNLVNTSQEDVGGVPVWLTVTVHPVVAMALGSLLVEFGARRVTFCDQLPFRELGEEAFAGYGYRLGEFQSAMDGRARFVNTRNRMPYGEYAWVKVPNGELAFAWEVNKTYVETDVLVSLAKLKNHVSAGVTGGMKNLFGVPPSSLYGDDLTDHPDEGAIGYRNATMHNCTRQPFTSGRSFTGRSVEGDHGYNVPRFIVDLAEAFPISLVVIDGISTIQTAEGWWNGSMVSVTRPGLLIAGRNAVSTDAVAASVMGFNPDAPDRTPPFSNGSNYLALARQRGLGENRIDRIEIAGASLDAARFEFHPTYRRKAPAGQ
ncbi:MAG TPA: DUF362 domain-containing protein [Verrucomicrobiota bacterium]|nr:DUF362 domain-containing protein [Verrucomicrobiota bacterium]